MSEKLPKMCYTRVPIFEILSGIFCIPVNIFLILKKFVNLKLKKNNNNE
jgi:hypothetical protein